MPVTAQRTGSSWWQAVARATLTTDIHTAIQNGVRVSSTA